MPLPTSINDLSTTAGSNSPAGTENPQTFDDYLRVYSSYIAALRDVVLSGTANLSTANLAYSGTLTGSTGVVNIGTGQIYKDASGNVGIGTTSPIDKFQATLTGTSGVAQSVLAITCQPAPAIGSATSGFGMQWGNVFNGIRSVHGGDSNNSGLSFSVGSAGVSYVERMRIKSTGQINLTGLAAAPSGAEGDIYYDNVTKKHYGHNGTSWNALY